MLWIRSVKAQDMLSTWMRGLHYHAWYSLFFFHSFIFPLVAALIPVQGQFISCSSYINTLLWSLIYSYLLLGLVIETNTHKKGWIRNDIVSKGEAYFETIWSGWYIYISYGFWFILDNFENALIIKLSRKCKLIL